MKKALSLVLALLMLASVMSIGVYAEEQEMLVWIEKIFSDEANELISQRIQQYGEENGIKVTVELIGATDITTKFNAALEAGKGVPDVISSSTNKTLNYYPNIPFVDVSDLVAEINTERPYFESTLDGCAIGGAYYYVPLYSSSCLMFVRMDKLTEAGISEVPTTWEGVVEAARAISDPENDFYGLGMGCGENDDDDENMWREWMWNEAEAYMLDAEGNITAGEGKIAEMLDFFGELYKEGVIPSDSTTWGAGGNNGSYLAGRTGFVFNAPTLYNALRNSEEYAELLANTVILAPPTGKANGVYMNFPVGLSITNACKDVDVAADLIRYIVDKEWYDEFTSKIAPINAPLFQDELENPVWTDDAVNAQVLAYAQNASGYYGYPAETLEGRALAAKHYFNFPYVVMVNKVFTGSATGAEAVKDTVRLLEDIQDMF